MPSCEKCWSDSATVSGEDHAKAYRELLKTREQAGRSCTPEAQAGQERSVCGVCGANAVHQYAGVCMACGREERPMAWPEGTRAGAIS